MSQKDFPSLTASPEDQQAGFRWERAHRLPEAVECYLVGGAYADAARVLNHIGWFYEAGAALLLYLPPREIHVAMLDRERKKICLDASVCFARAGARIEAVGLLVSFGEHHKAASLLIRAGLRREAVAAMRGEPVEGSPWPQDYVSPLMSADDVLSRVQDLAVQQKSDYEAVVAGFQSAVDPFEPAGPRASFGSADVLSVTGFPAISDEVLEQAYAPPAGPDPDEESKEEVRAATPSYTYSQEALPPEPEDRDAGHYVGPGTVIRDRYVVEKEIGSGGMATVYSVMDEELTERVALKLFRVVTPDPLRLKRFRREMKINRMLRHDNIVNTLEYGSWAGARYITMELLEGLELWEHLRTHRLDLGDRIRLLMQICDGLGYAHDQGIVHRDIKPSNLFVCSGDHKLKIMDFGIAKAVDSSEISITGVRVGTPRYMSPEQIQGGQPVGPAADLYSLGAVMYEAMTGRAPFEDEELLPLLLNHLSEEPVPPSQLNEDLPPEIDDICLRLLSKNPRERFVDCAATKSALLRAYVMSERRR
ncbi:MAG: serine/threonine protein kinase [Deltaproteobacteria bacterium]|nr:serine/threonine protein kinase [Deltaproteobacteria bacterium]